MSNRAISTELIELGERIRKRRQEMKLSQESFAEKAGISVNTVSRIEGGQTAMSVEIFRKMIEILEIDANILLGKEGGGTEKQESIQEVLCRIQKMEWKEQNTGEISPYMGCKIKKLPIYAKDNRILCC